MFVVLQRNSLKYGFSIYLLFSILLNFITLYKANPTAANEIIIRKYSKLPDLNPLKICNANENANNINKNA